MNIENKEWAPPSPILVRTQPYIFFVSPILIRHRYLCLLHRDFFLDDTYEILKYHEVLLDLKYLIPKYLIPKYHKVLLDNHLNF